ncbi:hypothetical protein [Flavobacterium pectinovorum]|uniref:hypothetical protein n=1 Tax=Flavobacterium pectinovorum TaxID=29533 RepID=UPI001FABDE29|nr:hypothetical protein [Flavobacterium pectinovorum]MCI9843193.1 hypothetical protein [Flavobacterium pectinovorum]
MKNLMFLALTFATNVSISQNIFKNESIGFSIEQPEKWIKAKEGQTIENLKSNIKLDEKVIAKLLEQNKGTIQVVTYFKYPIETTAGIIPTIKVNLRSNPHKNFADFRKSIEESFISIKKVFSDFKYTSEPTESVINGRKCITASCIYTLTGIGGSEKVNIIVYAIPVKDQFYQVTLMDTKDDNNTELFQKIINTIAIK